MGQISDTDSQVDTLPLAALVQPEFREQSFGATDIGNVRPTNEDQFVIVELARTMHVQQTSLPQAPRHCSVHRGHLYLVADGVGGHQAGEVASALSVLTIESFVLNTLNRLYNFEREDEPSVLKEFKMALLQADKNVFDHIAAHPEFSGMGSTLTLAYAVQWKLFVAHAGDSRCYHFSKTGLHQLTRDHTLVAALVRAGTLTTEQAARHPSRNVVTNVIGGRERGVHAECHRLDLEPGDVVLICSDGLTGMVSDERIAAILQELPDPQASCERLIAEAKENGGKDNITAIVSHFGDARPH